MTNDTEHPDFLAACTDAHVLPDMIFFRARTDERSSARRAVTCRLLHAGWRPGRVADLMGISVHQIQDWAKRCPVRFKVDAWRPPAGVSRTPLGRKLRRMRTA